MHLALQRRAERKDTKISLREFYQHYQPQLRNLLQSKGTFSEATLAWLEGLVQKEIARLFTEEPSQYLFVIWDSIHGITDCELQKMTRVATKNFGLNEADFLDMTEQLRQGKEDLFERIFLAHFQECQEYIQQKDAVTGADAYDATMEAMLEMRAGLLAGKIQYGNLRFLFTRMARQGLMRRNKQRPVQTELTPDIDHYDTPDGFTEDEYQLLSQCWNDLSHDCRDLLQEVYFDQTPLKELAVRLGKSHAAMRKQKQRCLQQLKQLFLERS